MNGKIIKNSKKKNNFAIHPLPKGRGLLAKNLIKIFFSKNIDFFQLFIIFIINN